METSNIYLVSFEMGRLFFYDEENDKNDLIVEQLAFKKVFKSPFGMNSSTIDGGSTYRRILDNCSTDSLPYVRTFIT